SKEADSTVDSTGSRTHWMFAVEKRYARILRKILNWRGVTILSFLLLLAGSAYVYMTQLKFVMFPREESTQISVRAVAPQTVTRHEMARLIDPLERIFMDDKHVVTS